MAWNAARRVPDVLHLPLFQLKRQLGQGLNAAEQGSFDADEPNDRDLALFLADLNAVHFQRDQIRL
ncbi:MAG: hypothetical protein A2580_07920 [Hydrogenophilales bacterium RIFOXYD1_FULL_62_11]|nr:MAG: hypothetical protein A2580_07920 [Hydrogenophilales bacterium RIFOXYD1_FULL_62_11]